MLSKAIKNAAERVLTRKIVFVAANNKATQLTMTLQYVHPKVFHREQDEARTRVLQDRQANPLADLPEEQRQIMRLLYQLLAIRVLRIDDGPEPTGVSVRKLSELIPLAPEDVKGWGGLATFVCFDSKDPSPITDDDRAKFGYGDDLKTRGEAGLENIIALISANDGIREWVQRAITDVSLFQDPGDYKDQVKN